MAPRQSAVSQAVSAQYKFSPADVIVYIGRFSPFHLGHAHVLKESIKRKPKLIIMLVGSAGLSRSLKNPFTFEERKDMINDYLDNQTEDEVIDRVTRTMVRVVASRDFPYNDTLWQRNVQRLVKATIAESKLFRPGEKPVIRLTGSDRDHTTWYLQSFPQWVDERASYMVEPYLQNGSLNVSATDVRAWLFRQPADIIPMPTIAEMVKDFGAALVIGRKKVLSFVENLLMNFLAEPDPDLTHIPDTLPETTLRFLERFKKTDKYQMLVATYKFVRDYRRRACIYPYPPIYQTVDVVIVQSGHVLTVVRGHEPGKGLWALPGGFVNQNERLRDAAIREAIEETGIRLAEGKNWRKITEDILRGSIRKMHVLDMPGRSERGRTISHLFYIRLDDTKPLPVIQGSNQGNVDPECDVTDAFWLPVDEALERMDMWFEDHHAGIETSIGSEDLK
jgi:bifunctional NMN adenylyltransferase/nudix hydrolase